MNSDIAFFFCVAVLIALFAGEPDIADAIIYRLTDGAIAVEVKPALQP